MCVPSWDFFSACGASQPPTARAIPRQTTQIPCHGLTKRCIKPKRRGGETPMQIAAPGKSLGTDPTRAEHWPVPRRQAWFAFVMAFLLMVFDYMDPQVVVSIFPAPKAQGG